MRVKTACKWLWRKIKTAQTTHYIVITACTQIHTAKIHRSRVKHLTCRSTAHSGTYFCFSLASLLLLLRFCRLEGGTECTEELFLLEEWEEWEEWDKLVRDWPALWSNCIRQKIRSVGTSSNSYGGFVITYLAKTRNIGKVDARLILFPIMMSFGEEKAPTLYRFVHWLGVPRWASLNL